MNPPHLTEDAASILVGDLIAGCLQGERVAFRRLVELHQQYVFTLAFRVLQDEEDARDVVQETFVRVWKHLPAYDPRTKFTTWLYTIALNLSYDTYRGNTRRRRWLLPSARAEHEDGEGTNDEEMNVVNRDLASRIKELAEGLPTKQRLVFLLRDIQDLPIDEVARILSMSTNAVKANLSYARRHIRTRMQTYERKEGLHHEM